MLFPTLVISAQLSILAFALPAPLNDSITLSDIKAPSSIVANKDLIQSLELAPTAKERISSPTMRILFTTSTTHYKAQ